MRGSCAASTSAAKGATIWMGFNKNVTAYVTKGREALAKVPGGDFTLVHHNAYKANELGECFERNAEGMLKNMAVHELALLATYYGVTVDNIASVAPDAEYSRCLTLAGPSGESFTGDTDAVRPRRPRHPRLAAPMCATETQAPSAVPPHAHGRCRYAQGGRSSRLRSSSSTRRLDL
mgnify:CR=1 FL=1